ncbi:MAG: hypothetical protein FWG43_00010 [Clostridiales bacterium]|nr:hypothetical protein [Clostridiales bacterium]
MKKSHILFISLAVALALVAGSFTTALARDTMPDPIDPQSWKLQEDMLWNELKPNPVIDWMTELNKESLVNPMGRGAEPIKGALVLVDFWDRPFIATQELNTDLLGYYLYDEFGKFEPSMTKNPVIHVDANNYREWIRDYLNKNQEINRYRSIDEFWRENSYGKWAVDLDSFGPYHMQGFEFEFDLSYTNWSDLPPTFRRATSGASNYRNMMNEGIAAALADGHYLGDYDFFFILHSGYDESSVWLEFGQMQWARPEDVPYEYGPGAKMEEVEEILTANPAYLLALETTMTNFSGNTPVINGYIQGFLREKIAEVKARQSAGTLAEFEFRFPAADWAWQAGYSYGNAGPTRYVPWSSWIATISRWSSSGSSTVPRSPENGGGSRSIRQSGQGESDGMGVFAHEFGHITGLSDNYEATMWTQNVSPKTEYWDLMSRGDKVGPGGYHSRWMVPSGREAGSSPAHYMMYSKQRASYYDSGDLLELSVAQVKARTPVVAEIVARNIPMNNGGLYPQLEEYGLISPNFYKAINLTFDNANPDTTPLVTTGYSLSRWRAGRTAIEVVDRSGYDSFAADHGVLISRIQSGSTDTHRWVVDSHLYNINLIDYYLNGLPTYYCIGHSDQLNDALFHAGKSSVDTGYYKGDYTVNNNGTFVAGSGSKHGSARQWEPRNGREIMSGDTVNEWHDTYNKLHFYILAKNYNEGKYGEFLSYSIGMLHDDGVAVGGGLNVELAELEAETPGKVAVANFCITNTGDATDIVRVGVAGDYSPALLNDLYAIEAGQTITVPVYVQLPYDIRTKVNNSQKITLTASSESNSAKVGGASVLIEKLVATNYEVSLVPTKGYYSVGEDLLLDLYLKGDINYTQIVADIVFDAELLKYEAYTYLTGWVAAVTPGVGKVSVRSMPTSNMVLGAPCADEVKVATLKFSVKDVIEEISAETVLTLQNVMVTPAGTMKDFGTTPTLAVPLTLISPATTPLTDIKLITGAELEIAYPKVVPNDYIAQCLFDITLDGEAVEWEFLSYFDFGTYAERGGVVNVRLKEELETGEPRGRRRESAAESFMAETQSVLGPPAAARIKVATFRQAANTAIFDPFFTERSLGNMSRLWTYGSKSAGNNGQRIKDWADSNNGNVFSATAQPLYTEEYIVRQVGEGLNRFVGRSEYMNLPIVDAGFKAFFVGPQQSVYEAPAYRELYEYSLTTDTFTRKSIKATEVPGNFDGEIGFAKPYIVGTSDDVMRHYSPLKADGSRATGDADSARPREDHFHFAEAFFDMYYHLGLVEGSQRFPLSYFNDADDYRYDLHLEEAYSKAKAAGLWPGTKMMESVKDYYVYGMLVFWEMIPESAAFTEVTFPVNTRAEMYEYDYPLYWALCGAHGKYEYWTGVGNAQTINASNDSGKYNIPWFWHNQPDNFGLPATTNGTVGVAYEPLKIEKVTIISGNHLDVKFNREVKTVAPLTVGSNWRIYIDGKQITNAANTAPADPGSANGYNWQRIRLSTNYSYTWSSGSESNIHNRLDNGFPYGEKFAGFTQKDIDERKVSAGGWISNTQAPGRFPLDYGQYVGLEDAIALGAGAAGKVEVEYIGNTDVLDWAGNVLAKNVRYEAEFRPWTGIAYRSPLNGMYIYLDTNSATKDFYMYTRKGLGSNVTAKDIVVAAGHKYETQFTNNYDKTYPTSAGGAAFDNAFAVGSGTRTTTHAGAGMTNTYTWNNGTLTLSNQNIRNIPVTYDRVGQRIVDGAVRGGGKMLIAAGSVLGNHPGMQPTRSNMGGNISDSLRVEGWGGSTFQTEDVLIIRDYNLCRYKNESLVFHEGGHGIDSFAPAYAQNIYNDITAAWATAVSYANGAKYHDVDGIGAYMSVRGEYVSTWGPWYAGGGRESFQGINDGTWTPIATREEAFRYDPYGGEVFKRIFFGGELGLWYEGKIGDPDYRVMLEDWELLRDQNPEFSHWTSENNLVAWGFSIPPTSQKNPYTGQSNPLVRWVSWNAPSVWNVEPYREPTNPNFPLNIYDPVGRTAYHPYPEGKSPTIVETHPFLVGEGVKKPVRPAEIAALATPVSATVVESPVTMPRPVLVQFEVKDYSGKITNNNAQTSFELYVNGQLTAFYFWSFEEKEGAATVTLRVDWPMAADALITVKALVNATELVQEVLEVVEEAAELEMLEMLEEAVAEAVAETIVIIE